MAVWGLNLDPPNPVGMPADPAVLNGIKWVRMVLKAASQWRSINDSIAYYQPIVARYAAIGARTLFVLNQETFWGNGPWSNGNWDKYITDYAAAVRTIAGAFSGAPVDFEIWNESDNHSGSSIYINADIFGRLLAASYDAVKAVNNTAKVVSGGLAGGNQVNYIRQAMQVRSTPKVIDAIGVHATGQWTANFGRAPSVGTWFGKMETYLQSFVTAFPSTPIWITEVGFDLVTPSNYELVKTYITGINNLGSQFSATNVPVAMWFGWSDGMKHDFGLADAQNRPKTEILNHFMNAVKNPSTGGTPTPTPQPATFTNQQLINAFYAAADAMGNKNDYWNWIVAAGLSGIAKDQATRRSLYTGPAIDQLPNLTAQQKSLIIRALNGEDLHTTPRQVSLNVPWVSQIDCQGLGNNDCGDACVLMLISYRKSVDPIPPATEVFSRLSGATSAAQLRGLANAYHLTLTVAKLHSLDDVRAQIDRGNPVIALVDYKDLGFDVHLATGIDQGDHWLLVVGYGTDKLIVHDPLWTPCQRGGRGGSYLDLPLTNANQAVYLQSDMLY